MQIDHCEQGSYEWHKLRQGKVTGTTLKSALGSPKVQETLMYKLIAERMTEPQIEDINNAAIQHGKEREPLARKAAEKFIGKEFQEVGMLVDSELDHFAVSPDGIYMLDGVVRGGIEIKCPNSKKHVEYVIKQEIPAEYIHQVKAPFLLCDTVDWWTFVSFDDRNYEQPLWCWTFTRAQYQDIESDRQKLEQFLAMVDEKHTELSF